MTWIVPNFRNKTVSEAESETPGDIGVKVKSPADEQWHEPDAAEQSAAVVSNGPDSQPGTTKTAGEWVGLEIQDP